MKFLRRLRQIRISPIQGAFVAFLSVFLESASPAFASVVAVRGGDGLLSGLPTIVFTYPMMLFALLPMIIIETVVVDRTAHLGWKRLGWRMGFVNALSVVFGVPLMWFLCMLVQSITGGAHPYGVDHLWGKILAVTWQSPWLMWYVWKPEFHWMLPSAVMIGLLPAFFMSVGTEGLLLRHLLRGMAVNSWRLTWKANAVSYSILMGLGTLWLIGSIVKG